jgi:drug/metabolite transporter (DMT)-like permease
LLLAISGFALLSAGDVLVKTIHSPLPGIAIATIRYIFGAVLLGCLLWWREGRTGFTLPRPWVQLGRAVSASTCAACFFTALFLMPLTEATVITFLAPALVALFSSIFLKEHAPTSVWIAIAVAFSGVLIVLRPEVALIGWAGLLPLGTACGMAMLVIFNRMVAGTGSVLQMQFLISALAVPVLATLALAGHLSSIPALQLSWPEASVILRCGIVACSASIAHAFLYKATENSSAAAIAPATYVQLLVAMTFGFVLFGDVPDAAALGGAALIIGTGLYLWHAGRRLPSN